MNEYYADLHIHIGRTKSGKAVKITGSKTLTLLNIIAHARDVKGLDIVGVIDCHSPEVLDELEGLLAVGEICMVHWESCSDQNWKSIAKKHRDQFTFYVSFLL